MATDIKQKQPPRETGRWDELFKRTCSSRIIKGIERAMSNTEICIERSRAEVKTNQKYDKEPRVIQRARALETYLHDRTIFIQDGELIVGSVTSKKRASPISAECGARWMARELGDPEKDWNVRSIDRHVVHPEERRELKEEILPYWQGNTFEEKCEQLVYSVDASLKDTAMAMSASCSHIPNIGDLMLQKDIGHQMPNFEKVLYKGLKGIKEEVQWYLDELDQPYMHYGLKKKRDFYNAVLITLDAAMEHAERYAKLAKEMAAKEKDPQRKKELEKISEVCAWVPANPARDWWEALQSVWFTMMLINCELLNLAHNFGRFDQYMYPFYEKSVIDGKTMTRDEALELLECFWVKDSEWTALWSFEVAPMQAGFPMSQNLLIGGQTPDGEDACNDVTMLCIEAEEQVGLLQPEIAFLIWDGTPDEYLRRAAEVARLGRGKMKFYSQKNFNRALAKAYPDLSIEDYRDPGAMGCVEPVLPAVTMANSFSAITIVPKILELALTNGKCAICGKQIGPATGNPSTFESMNQVLDAYNAQLRWWMRPNMRAAALQFEGEAKWMQAPFCSSLLEGPLKQGLDVAEGGCWYNHYGMVLGGVATTGDSLGVIDKLIYRDRKITWDQLLQAMEDNWEGHEELQKLVINGVPKYGNDDEYADQWPAWVMNSFIDCIDYYNNNDRSVVPHYGGKWLGIVTVNSTHVAYGYRVGAMPDGHVYPQPVSDCMSPTQGRDKLGPTAVLKSASKMPIGRFGLGHPLNQKLHPQMVATERDMDNFVAYLRAFQELGINHIQFNIITADLLRRAMQEPDKYRDLMVRVGSYCSYFVELDSNVQLEIINRTEQTQW